MVFFMYFDNRALRSCLSIVVIWKKTGDHWIRVLFTRRTYAHAVILFRMVPKWKISRRAFVKLVLAIGERKAKKKKKPSGKIFFFFSYSNIYLIVVNKIIIIIISSNILPREIIYYRLTYY